MEETTTDRCVCVCALIADAYSPDDGWTPVPYQFRTAAAVVQNSLEIWALDDGLRDLRVLATVPV